MAHLALDRALPASWIDEVFQAHLRWAWPAVAAGRRARGLHGRRDDRYCASGRL